jgi:hypothetical protein
MRISDVLFSEGDTETKSWERFVLLLQLRPSLEDVIQVCCFSIINLFMWMPFLLRLVFKKAAPLAKGAVSDIPGNVHAFDDAIISAFQTLPEPNNFNVVYTGLSVSQDMIIKGKVPRGARFSSISIYPAPGTPGAPAELVPDSIDLARIVDPADGSFELRVLKSANTAACGTSEKQSKAGAELTLCSQQWERGYIAMRNYLVPPGTRVVTPRVETTSGVLLRDSDVQIAGPVAYHNKFQGILDSLFDLVSISVRFAFLYWAFLFVVEQGERDSPLGKVLLYPKSLVGPHWEQLTTMGRNYLLSWVGTHMLRSLFFVKGSLSLKKMVRSLLNNKINSLIKVDLESGAQVSQPSALHTYFVAQLCMPQTQELHIDFKFDPLEIKYWSVVVYNRYGLPMGNFAYDLRDCLHSTDKSTSVDEGEHVHVQVAIGDLSGRGPASPSGSGLFLDAGAACQQGYVLVRTVNGEPLSLSSHVIDHELNKQVGDYTVFKSKAE